MWMDHLNIRKVLPEDLAELTEIMNMAYRSEHGGWTTEYGVVSGQRITEQLLHAFIDDFTNRLYVAEMEQNLNGQAVSKVLLGCIGITQHQVAVEIGSFCIRPEYQNRGLGRILLNFAEQQAVEGFPEIRTLQMYVLDVRTELMNYYERRGYERTGIKEQYPVHANVGIPLVSLQLELMIRHVSVNKS